MSDTISALVRNTARVTKADVLAPLLALLLNGENALGSTTVAQLRAKYASEVGWLRTQQEIPYNTC